MNTIYTYYEPLSSDTLLNSTHEKWWRVQDQLELIELWRKSWSKHGWNPIVLSENDAKQHPRYAEFKKQFWDRPTASTHNYTGGTYMRWAALAQAISEVGWGYMSDYDTMCHGFNPQPIKNCITVFCQMDYWIVPCLISGSIDSISRLLDYFVAWRLDSVDIIVDQNRVIPHASDMTLMTRLYGSSGNEKTPIYGNAIKNGANAVTAASDRSKPGLIQTDFQCRTFQQEGWKTAVAVHYHTSRMLKFMPKYKFIETLRPI